MHNGAKKIMKGHLNIYINVLASIGSGFNKINADIKNSYEIAEV